MKGSRGWRTAAPALAALFAAGCGAASGQTSGTPAPASADVRFLQGMIPHHAQALEMTALAESRAAGADVRLVAQRITVSQQDEIAQMQRWLRARDQPIPDAHAHHGSHAAMPGMLTPQEMARLAASTGAEFDRLFLEGMIRHHEGALAMVAELFATQGAAQESDLYAIASEVDADQRMEIARMRAMLDAVPPSTPR
jgi:uncharacterized protein (DUF305 family)